MPDIHAKLSVSSARRRMSCLLSIRLGEQFLDSGSEYAVEGTLAHSLVEIILRYNNSEISKKAFSTRFSKIKADPMCSREMQGYIEDCTQRVWGTTNEVKAACPDIWVLFEQRLDVSEYVPDEFGTGDVVIVVGGMINIIDLRYGRDVGVSVEGSSQLRLYGLGAYLEHSILYDIRRMQMAIIQSRLENISVKEPIAEELLNWVE